MIKVKLARYEDLPEDIEKEFSLPNRRKGKEYAGYLLIYDGMELTRVESDDIQPEDVSFTRDLSWVKEAIEDAYKKGIRDGRKLKGDDKQC